ncbi:hypothetical protein ACH4E5_19735 [Streptomyces afghaniensis]|uniref:hypothetical protein n=1 Tax=Streptomyces afghaniensis TaxID=66865 RepID=UPI0037BB45DD
MAGTANGLAPHYWYVDLTIHSLWSLLAIRPNLPVMLDGQELPARARRELDSIRYAIRLAEA